MINWILKKSKWMRKWKLFRDFKLLFRLNLVNNFTIWRSPSVKYFLQVNMHLMFLIIWLQSSEDVIVINRTSKVDEAWFHFWFSSKSSYVIRTEGKTSSITTYINENLRYLRNSKLNIWIAVIQLNILLQSSSKCVL